MILYRTSKMKTRPINVTKWRPAHQWQIQANSWSPVAYPITTCFHGKWYSYVHAVLGVKDSNRKCLAQHRILSPRSNMLRRVEILILPLNDILRKWYRKKMKFDAKVRAIIYNWNNGFCTEMPYDWPFIKNCKITFCNKTYRESKVFFCSAVKHW